jgi:hypothetical protein
MIAMKTYARIQDHVVAELLTTDLDITGRFNPALMWVDVSGIPGVAPGWHQSSTGLSPPPAPLPPVTPSLPELQIQLATISAQLAAFSQAP